MRFPAIHVRGVDGDLALAAVYAYAPTAAQEQDDGLLIFFSRASERDRALQAVRAELSTAAASACEIDDEDWGRRSQQNLPPVTVGRVTILSDEDHRGRRAAQGRIGAGAVGSGAVGAGQPHVAVTIRASTGFGTGHHVTTRLCLAGLQMLDPAGKLVLDLGTGSGVLAIAARRLGARHAIGIDSDPDAVRAAIRNLRLNPDADSISFTVANLTSAALPHADIVTANLTGTLLQRAAVRIESAVAPGGALVLSGLMADERTPVVEAFGALELTWERQEDGWAGLAFRRAG